MPNKNDKATIDEATKEILQSERDKPKPPEGFKLNPLYIETKTRRVQLLMQPSLFAWLKEQAGAEKTSVNDLIHSILETAKDQN